MEIIIICIVWLISPIPLLILWLRSGAKSKKQNAFLQQLLDQHRILPEELKQAGIKLPRPKTPQIPQQAAQPVLPPAAQSEPSALQPANTSDSLAAAAARAAQIAEAELSGTSVPAAAQIGDIVVPDAVIAEAEPFGEIIAPPAAESVPEPSGEIIAPETEKSPAAETAAPVPPQNTPPQPVTQPAAAIPKHISAITLMLSVGVLLVIVAGLIFVRTTWDKLSDIGRLATLAAGSILFFGTSALAKRTFKLERTSMAFFTLGAAFLPISVWAAGYLNLLGDRLSGAGNPWLIALSFGSFTVIALLAVIFYRMKGWGAAFLSGLTITYVCITEALTIHRDTPLAPFLIAVTVYALLLAFGTKLLAPRIPKAIGSVLEPFAIIITALSSIITFAATLGACHELLHKDDSECWYYWIPALLAAFAFFSPILTERIKAYTVIPASLLAVPAFTLLLYPIYNTVFYTKTDTYIQDSTGAYYALMLMICAMIWLILLLTNSLPDETRRGFRIGAGVLTALSIPVQLAHLTYNPLKVAAAMFAAGAVLLAVWVIGMRKQSHIALHALIGAQVWMLCMIAADAVAGEFASRAGDVGHIGQLCAALCFLPGFIALVLTKKHRTGFSDLLLTVSPVFPLISLIAEQPLLRRLPYQWGGLMLLLGFVVLYWFLAFAHDTRKPQQYAFAVLSPLLLAVTAVASGDGLLRKTPDMLLPVCWSILSYLLGAAAYFTTPRRFHGVRKLLFGLTAVPPIVVAFCIEIAHPDAENLPLQLLGIAGAAGLWLLFANRGFRALSVTSFSTALLMLLETTACLVWHRFYDDEMNYNVLLIASVWILLFSLLAIVISRRMLFFVGSGDIPAVMQAAAPAAALILSGGLIFMQGKNWEVFYFVYVVGLCILAWFTTKKSQIILPSVCALSFIFTVDALRSHSTNVSAGTVVLLLFAFVIMTVLFPYLGIVSREADEEPKMQRRTWVLTGVGGVVPFWLLTAANIGTQLASYTREQREWMYFFVPVLIAGYLLHFLLFEKDENRRRTLMTAAAGFGVIALWMQPLVDVSDTWFENKLHILPLVLFGIVLRQLYGEKAGGNFLFGVGVYTMLRLAITAVATEAGSDLLTLLITAMLVFIASFYIRQKKWFLLGGITLILTAMYMHMKLTDGKQWWVYLLFAGLVLIVVAGSNEMLKQRGESLKSKAGKLWDEWTW